MGDLALGLTGADGQAAVGDLDVLQEVDVAGLPDRQATIDGGVVERVFEVHAPARLRLSHLELTRSFVFGGGGGGLRIGAAAGAVLFDVEIEAQSAAGEGGGGALVEGELFGEDVWFHDNATNLYGGAIALDGAEARLELRRARITGNQNAQGDGGGIAVVEGESSSDRLHHRGEPRDAQRRRHPQSSDPRADQRHRRRQPRRLRLGRQGAAAAASTPSRARRGCGIRSWPRTWRRPRPTAMARSCRAATT